MLIGINDRFVAHPSAPSESFGHALKGWRTRRRLSQLALALQAGVSARHIAFLETGRARPSREMVIGLAAAMDVPLHARNALLSAAGFAAIYAARPLDEGTLAPVRAALDQMLTHHDPYPGILLDRHWNLLQANQAATVLLGPLLGDGPDRNVVRQLVGNPQTAETIINWSEVAGDLLTRLRLESVHAGGDSVLDALTALLSADPALARKTPPLRAASAGPFIGVRMRSGNTEIALFSLLAEFGAVDDITVRGLRLELFFPANDASAEALRGSVSLSAAGSTMESGPS